jgi:hypothetical protein
MGLRGLMWLEGGLAGSVDGHIEGLEFLMNYDPMNSHVSMIRGCIIYRGASGSIGHEPYKLSHS